LIVGILIVRFVRRLARHAPQGVIADETAIRSQQIKVAHARACCHAGAAARATLSAPLPTVRSRKLPIAAPQPGTHAAPSALRFVAGAGGKAKRLQL